MPSQDRGTRETFALAEVLHQEPIKATGGPLGYPGICLTFFSLRGPRPSLVQEKPDLLKALPAWSLARQFQQVSGTSSRTGSSKAVRISGSGKKPVTKAGRGILTCMCACFWTFLTSPNPPLSQCLAGDRP